MTIKNMADLISRNQRVLIREDFNVPMQDGEIVSNTRIAAALPTLRLALEAKAQVIVMSHLGRPKEGVPISEQTEFSLAPIAAALENQLGFEVRLVQNYLDDPASIGSFDGITLLENVRINIGEKANEDELAKKYASLCDLFVMDAFGTAHRAQASTHGVAKFAANKCAGPLLSGELDALHRSLENPQRPMLAIVGGAKVSSKLGVLENLAGKVDQLIVGGGIANTFLAAAGHEVGKSLFEKDLIDSARQLMKKVDIPLPTDVVVAREFSSSAQATIKPITEVSDDDMILDIGPDSAARLATLISEMKTIIWNGPMGVFEYPQFAQGTRSIAEAIAKNKGFSIAGGGETIAAIDKFAVMSQISYLSTGGGAFLEFVQGKILPAVEILDN